MNLASSIPLSFRSDRFLVRRYEMSDAEQLYQAASQSIPEVFQFLPWCHPDYAFEDSISWLEIVQKNWKEDSGYSFGIFSPDESEFFGGCGINRIDEHPTGNLGYWIKSAAVGQGIATEATRALIDFGFRHLGLKRIEIIMSVKNPASRRVAEQSGGVFEGVMRNRLLLHDQLHDARLYSVVPEDIVPATDSW